MRHLRRLGATLAALGLWGCSSKAVPGGEQEGGLNEPSPNAQILPAPLSGSSNRSTSATAQAPEARSAVPIAQALYLDDLLPGLAQGLEFRVEFALPEVRRGVELREAAERAQASWVVEVLPALVEAGASRPARQRVRLEGALFNLPESTELRSRGDQEGLIVVWPDGRSYRTVPSGAVASLVQERRVDVMPTFEGLMSATEESTQGERTVRVRRVKSPLGELALTLGVEADATVSTPLFCELLLGFLRTHTVENPCHAGEFPLEFKFTWAEGGELRGTVAGLKRRNDLKTLEFAVPPDLAIFKPGELPPDLERPWPDALTRLVAPVGPGPSLTFKNLLEVPVLLLLDGIPVVRLDPAQEWQTTPGHPGVRYQARDFLGRGVRQGGLLNAPAVVHLGAEPELRPEGAAASSPVTTP